MIGRTQVEHRGDGTVLLFESLLAAVAGASLAWMFGLLAGLTSQGSLILMIAAGLLAGGGAFSLLEMHGRAQRNREQKSRRAAELDAFEATLVDLRTKAEQANPEPAGEPEPYRHHEDHPESPGHDQGQLTANLPNPTPFVNGSPRPNKPRRS